jgi:hypothetical protein
LAAAPGRVKKEAGGRKQETGNRSGRQQRFSFLLLLIIVLVIVIVLVLLVVLGISAEGSPAD